MTWNELPNSVERGAYDQRRKKERLARLQNKHQLALSAEEIKSKFPWLRDAKGANAIPDAYFSLSMGETFYLGDLYLDGSRTWVPIPEEWAGKTISCRAVRPDIPEGYMLIASGLVYTVRCLEFDHSIKIDLKNGVYPWVHPPERNDMIVQPGQIICREQTTAEKVGTISAQGDDKVMPGDKMTKSKEESSGPSD